MILTPSELTFLHAIGDCTDDVPDTAMAASLCRRGYVGHVPADGRDWYFLRRAGREARLMREAA